MKVIGIAGYSGSGKTTLIEKVIPVLVGEGLRVSLVKHAHHEFDVDQPGKDSYRHRHAGCLGAAWCHRAHRPRAWTGRRHRLTSSPQLLSTPIARTEM